jgi:3-isopropylmalate dehydrogenase
MAGKDVANPIGAVLSTALLLEHLGQVEAARAVERAVGRAVAAGETTADIGGRLGTREAGDRIAGHLRPEP